MISWTTINCWRIGLLMMGISMFVWSRDFSEIGLLRLKFWNELLMLIISSNKNKTKTHHIDGHDSFKLYLIDALDFLYPLWSCIHPNSMGLLWNLMTLEGINNKAAQVNHGVYILWARKLTNNSINNGMIVAISLSHCCFESAMAVLRWVPLFLYCKIWNSLLFLE